MLVRCWVRWSLGVGVGGQPGAGAGATQLWPEGEGGVRGGTSREPWKGDGQQAGMGAGGEPELGRDG